MEKQIKYQFLLIILLSSCSSGSALSEGPFDIRESKAFERMNIYPIIDLDRDTLSNGRNTTGKAYFENDKMFKDIATDLGLSYVKKFFYYTDGEIYHGVKIGEDTDTVEFEIRNYDFELVKGEITQRAPAIGIMAKFTNKTHTFDTTFVRQFLVTIVGN